MTVKRYAVGVQIEHDPGKRRGMRFQIEVRQQRIGPIEESLHSLMQLTQGGIPAHANASPDMRAGPAQNDAKAICVNLLI
jgi:hypothetical protein